MHISSVSFAYPEVDGATRADLTRSLQHLVPSDAFLLSTCLRIELAVGGDLARLEQAVKEAFDDPAVMERGTVRVGEDAIRHLFRVAAGLESPILGEREIFTQFRQAVAAAEDLGRMNGLLAKVMESAIHTGRQARELLPESPHDSLAAVAAQAVGSEEAVAVLGSGLMSNAVVRGLVNLPAPPEIVVVARSPEKVTFGEVEVWPFDRAGEALARFPAVVSATSAKKRLVPDDLLRETLEGRSIPLILVDMAMPPDFSPPDHAPVRYVDIDKLARMAARRPRREDADEMVSASAADVYRKIADHHAVGPVIGDLMRSADDIVDRTVDRFAGRLTDPDDRSVLRQTAHTVARTLLAGPVSYLQSSDRPSEAVDVVADAFGLEDE